MRQEHETAASFKEIKEITQTMRALKNGAPTNATNQESKRTQATKNANISDRALKQALKPKTTAHAKKRALNPTKRAFSERQITTIRDNSQASANKSLETQQGNKQGDNANAFKSDEANQRGQQ